MHARVILLSILRQNHPVATRPTTRLPRPWTWSYLEELFRNLSNKSRQGLALSNRHISHLWRQRCFSESAHCVYAHAMRCAGGSSRVIFLSHAHPPLPAAWSVDHSPSTRCVCSIRISSAMLVRDSRHELRERRVRPAGAARERGNEACHRRVGMAVEHAQVDRVDRSASRAADPQEPIAGGDCRADRRRKDHGHPLGLALVPGGD
jgi:hypothetical protein